MRSIFPPTSPFIRRRQFLLGAGGTALLVAAPALTGRAAELRKWKSNPFSLGVASGSPAPDGFVLWTRLAPEPENYDPAMPAGMSGAPVTVNYEIGGDPQLRSVVKRGVAVAEPEFAYSVHAEIGGLKPGRPYWYRFSSGDAQSAVGRAVTVPSPGAKADRLRFGFVSCSNYEQGYFSAYRYLAEEQPDLAIFLGDYIYEYIDTRSTDLVRKHSEGMEADSLPTYRNRYTQYRLDPDLQQLHAATTALMTWDDHEVQNDYANEASQTFDDPQKFLQRRAAGYRAFYEHMPLRAPSRPNGAMMRIYDRYAYGDLATIFMLDGRQYRSREACYRQPAPFGGAHLESNASCPERLDASRSIIGMAQEGWLFDSLAKTKARWTVIAQDMLMSEFRQKDATGVTAFWTDDWNGYPVSRARVLQHIHDAKVPNPVVIGGDIHSYWANDVKLDFDDPASPTIASEFVGTSITAHPPDYDAFMKFMPDNPHVRFFDSRKRGYVSAELTGDRMTTQFRVVSDVNDPKATISTLKSFVVENGKPGPVDA